MQQLVENHGSYLSSSSQVMVTPYQTNSGHQDGNEKWIRNTVHFQLSVYRYLDCGLSIPLLEVLHPL